MFLFAARKTSGIVGPPRPFRRSPLTHLHTFVKQSNCRAALARLIHDLKFLLGRPEEIRFVVDQVSQIHHRRLWVEEREQHECQLAPDVSVQHHAQVN